MNRIVLDPIAFLGLVLLFAGSQRGESSAENSHPSRKLYNHAPSSPLPVLVSAPTATKLPIDTTSIFMNGVPHHNRGGRVDKGTYMLEYQPMPGSVKFKYTPRVVLKTMTSGTDLQVTKFPSFALTPDDLTMYFSKGVNKDEYEALLARGWSHINSRDVFNANGGNVSDPTRPGRNIPWTRRAHMTQPNNFDWIPDFQGGKTLSSAQIEQVVPWVLGDGVSNYFSDGQPPQWHLLDWEFKYNDQTWTQLADRYHREYPNRYLMGWMGYSQIGLHRLGTYDAWPEIGYYHLTDWQSPGTNCSDDDPQHLENWKALWHTDSWGILQSLRRPEWMLQNHPSVRVLNGIMTAYEDGAGGPHLNYDYYKLHPSLAENGPLWGLLASRSLPGKKGGFVLWNSPSPDEPLTSEQYLQGGMMRLSLHNTVRNSASYQWVKPLISFDDGATWKEQASIEGNLEFSSLNYRQERSGRRVKEPIVRCIVTPQYATVYAQNPYNDSPASQTLKIRIPGIIEDYITLYNVRKRVGNLIFNDREMTMAVARRR